MVDHPKPKLPPEQIAAYALETGATEAQIREIVELVGTDRASILREARLIARPRRS